MILTFSQCPYVYHLIHKSHFSAWSVLTFRLNAHNVSSLILFFTSFLSAAMLSYVLLLLLLLPRCLGCQTSSFTECQKVEFVPGHNLVGEGFNVVTMKTSGASVVNVRDYMVGGVQGNCTVCYNHLLNKVPQHLHFHLIVNWISFQHTDKNYLFL